MPKPGETPSDDDVLELTEEQKLDAGDDQQDDKGLESGTDVDDGATGDDAGSEGGDDDEEETVVSFGDAPDVDQEGDSTVIRALRKELREAKERIRSTERAPAQRELRAEPTSADHAFDDDAFKADYKSWLEEKAEIEGEQRQASAVQQANQREWEADVQRYETQKAELQFDDLDDVTDAVSSSLNLAQQAVLVKAAEKPALFMYALGKAPAKLAELAKITDVIKLAAAIAKMEGSVTVTKRRKGPNLDKPQRGSGAIVSSDKKLAELEKKAEATGDRTELRKYRAELAKRTAKKKPH